MNDRRPSESDGAAPRLGHSMRSGNQQERARDYKREILSLVISGAVLFLACLLYFQSAKALKASRDLELRFESERTNFGTVGASTKRLESELANLTQQVASFKMFTNNILSDVSRLKEPHKEEIRQLQLTIKNFEQSLVGAQIVDILRAEPNGLKATEIVSRTTLPYADTFIRQSLDALVRSNKVSLDKGVFSDTYKLNR